MIKDKLRHISWLLSRSLYLDSNLIKSSGLNWEEKSSLLTKKYLELFKTHVLKTAEKRAFILGQDYYYYDDYAHSLLISITLDNLFLRELIKPRSVVVDVGANIGQYSFFAKYFLKAKEVISFEPLPQIYEVLKKNNPNSYGFGIGNKKQMKITIPDSDIFASTCLTPNKNSITIQLSKLDDVQKVKKLKHIDLLKIDVEGAEYDVLTSAKNTIAKTKYLLVEMSIDRPSMGGIQKVMAYLNQKHQYLKVIHVGNPLLRFGHCECVDVLFKNTDYD